MNKRLAIALYLGFGILLTLVLTFGKSVSHNIVDTISAEASRVEIEDVSVELADSYLVGKTVAPSYTAIGRIGGDPCLKFEALDDTLTVDKRTGEFKGVRTDADRTEGRIRISSDADSDFEKIITVSFEKKYPESFEAKYIVKSVGGGASYTRVGVPISTYLKIPSGLAYSESEFEIIYDPEYFVKIDKSHVMPIKETPEGVKVALTLKLKNGDTATTGSFTIKAEKAVSDFDEIRLTNKSSKPDGTVGSNYFLALYKNGKKLATDYTVSFAKKRASVNSVDGILFKKAGEEQITVTLPNGYSQTLTVNISNVVAAPTLPEAEDGILKLYTKNEVTLPLKFDKSATYDKVSLEYDSELLTASVKDGILTIKGTKLGESTLKLIVDDGSLRDERTYTVKTVIDTNLSRIIKNSTSIFVHKVLGHICGFALLALFSLNMFAFFKKRRPVLRFLHYSACALLFAAATELIQLYMPKRSSSFTDILIDMTGYYLGTLLLYPIFKLCARHRSQKHSNVPKTVKSGHVTGLKSVMTE